MCFPRLTSLSRFHILVSLACFLHLGAPCLARSFVESELYSHFDSSITIEMRIANKRLKWFGLRCCRLPVSRYDGQFCFQGLAESVVNVVFDIVPVTSGDSQIEPAE